MRLIDADALTKTLEKLWNIHDDQDFCNKDVWREIENAQTVEPEQKKGEWIHDGSQWANRWICSECEYKWFHSKEEAHFCPNCGTEMKRGDR